MKPLSLEEVRVAAHGLWLTAGQMRRVDRVCTDTRTETRDVCRREVYRREGFEVHRGLPFEAECELVVPENAMHSFKADHNEIRWKLVVAGDVAGWPDYQREFPVIVCPKKARRVC